MIMEPPGQPQTAYLILLFERKINLYVFNPRVVWVFCMKLNLILTDIPNSLQGNSPWVRGGPTKEAIPKEIVWGYLFSQLPSLRTAPTHSSDLIHLTLLPSTHKSSAFDQAGPIGIWNRAAGNDLVSNGT